MPMMRDVPELWAEWIDQHPDKCPRGILILPDGHVSMRGICGMQLIKRRNPRPAAADWQWTQYLFIAAQLFALPWAYWEALQRLHLTIIPEQSWTPYDRSIENLTIDDLAHFYAVQGITEVEVSNVFEYMYQWLTTAATQWPSQTAEIQSLLGEVNLAICEAGNRPPPGNGVQWWQL